MPRILTHVLRLMANMTGHVVLGRSQRGTQFDPTSILLRVSLCEIVERCLPTGWWEALPVVVGAQSRRTCVPASAYLRDFLPDRDTIHGRYRG